MGLLLAAALGGLVSSVPVTVAGGPPGDFDVQVVLGGNTRERAEISHRLWLRRRTPVIVTGDGGYTIQDLRARGVPASRLIHEGKARTTYENAANTAPMLRQGGYGRVVIVTSDYHAARALSCFRKVMPELEFSVCTTPAEERSAWENFQLRLRERGKRLGYAVIHGVPAWASP